jgi:hypothetical protein
VSVNESESAVAAATKDAIATPLHRLRPPRMLRRPRTPLQPHPAPRCPRDRRATNSSHRRTLLRAQRAPRCRNRSNMLPLLPLPLLLLPPPLLPRRPSDSPALRLCPTASLRGGRRPTPSRRTRNRM